MVKKGLIWLVRGYQRWFSHMLGTNCRFYPSCSQYAIDALQKYNVFYACLKIFWRLLRCGPWHAGGHDPA